MKSTVIIHIEDFREPCLQITPKLTSVINEAVKNVANEVGSEFFVAAICDRNADLLKIAA